MSHKARLTEEEKQAILGRITTTTAFEPLRDAAFVIEAITEDLAAKSEVFKKLDEITKTGCDSRFEHFVDFDYETWCGDAAA